LKAVALTFDESSDELLHFDVWWESILAVSLVEACNNVAWSIGDVHLIPHFLACSFLLHECFEVGNFPIAYADPYEEWLAFLVRWAVVLVQTFRAPKTPPRITVSIMPLLWTEHFLDLIRVILGKVVEESHEEWIDTRLNGLICDPARFLL
jgi:hypothetical protein